jgi:hypothetical protein
MTVKAETHEGLVAKAWAHDREDDSGTIAAFTIEGSPGAFWGSDDWLPLLAEAIELKTRVRVQVEIPEPERCADPMCGDGCCDDPNCTNVPEEERQRPFLVRADTIQWL